MKKISFSAESIEPVFNKIGELTKIQRYSIYCVTILLMVGSFIFFSYMPKQEKIGKLEKEYDKVKKDLGTAQKKAILLEGKKKEMEAAKAQFEIVKKTLPEHKEIPSLLAHISQAGRDSGLEFQLFKPNPEVSKNFYSEIPIAVNVIGSYHNLVLFFDKVSKLSRIVNIKNISVRNPGGAGNAVLNTSCTAVTYRFNEGS